MDVPHDGAPLTRVVHCQHEPYDVYVGRGRGSLWGNRYSHKPGTLAEFLVPDVETAVAEYRLWLKREIMAGRISVEALADLRGRTLGCWCKTAPLYAEPCHGDVLADAAEWAARYLGRC